LETLQRLSHAIANDTAADGTQLCDQLRDLAGEGVGIEGYLEGKTAPSLGLKTQGEPGGQGSRSSLLTNISHLFRNLT
jgi:hypothetical protein